MYKDVRCGKSNIFKIDDFPIFRIVPKNSPHLPHINYLNFFSKLNKQIGKFYVNLEENEKK